MLVGLALGVSAGAGPAALGQAVQPSGVRGAAPPAPAAPTGRELAAAGVVVPGQPTAAASSAADAPVETETAPAPPAGPVHPSGVLGSLPAQAAPTAADLAAAGVRAH